MSSDPVSVNLRQDLEQERNVLIAQLAEMGLDGGGDGLEYDSNFADTSQVTAERGEVAALATSLQKTLEEVSHALAKIDAGTFGSCERCGDQIPEARLDAQPTARLCIGCASKK